MSTVKTNRIANEAGDGVNVAGLGKIEDTGKNICTAWVKFDGTTTPPTIIDSFNIEDSIVRSSTGSFILTFLEAMDNANYCVSLGRWISTDTGGFSTSTTTTFLVNSRDSAGVYIDRSAMYVTIFGGKA